MISTEGASAGRGHQIDGKTLTRGTVIATALAVCVAQLAFAMPAVLNGLFQQDLGTSASQLNWISGAILLPITVLELTFGVLGDLYGRKRLLILGAGLIALGEIVSVLTPGVGSSTGTRVAVLMAGQALVGIGGGAVFPTTLAMVAAGTHTARDRGRAISVWAAALSTGGFLFPVLGGLAVKLSWGSDPYANWRWGMLVALLLALLSIVVSLVLARDSSAPEGRSLDGPGQVTIAVAAFALLFAIIQAPTSGWGSALVVTGFVVAAVFLGLFIVAERRAAAPLLRLEIFSSRAFSVTAVVTVLGMFAFLGTAAATSIRLTSVVGFTPLHASIAFVLLQGMTLAQVPLTMRLLPRVNPRWMLAVGFALVAAGDLWLSTTSAADRSLAPMIVPLILVGMGFAFVVSSVTAVAVNTVPTGLAGMASAATSQLRDLGFALGPALINAVALAMAASSISARVAASPSLSKALATFYALPGHVPAAQRAEVTGAVAAVKSGPLGANGVPATIPGPGGHPVPFNPVQNVAFHALDHAYKRGYFICGAAALLSLLLVGVLLGAATQRAEAPAPEDIVAQPTDTTVVIG